jgi:hypothetical protein
MTKMQALVTASKEFPQLRKLMDEYDFSDVEKTVDPTLVQPVDESNTTGDIHVQDRDLSYRENLRWAANAAGLKLRTGKLPATCPNNTAYYLFKMAIEEPKDFMAKVTSVESKIDKEEESRQGMRREALTAEADIHAQLRTLNEEATNV